MRHIHSFFFFFFNDTATTEIYTLSLHDALPIWAGADRHDGASRRALAPRRGGRRPLRAGGQRDDGRMRRAGPLPRSEEHTSELQSPCNLVCRLLLEKKKQHRTTTDHMFVSEHGI